MGIVIRNIYCTTQRSVIGEVSIELASVTLVYFVVRRTPSIFLRIVRQRMMRCTKETLIHYFNNAPNFNEPLPIRRFVTFVAHLK